MSDATDFDFDTILSEASKTAPTESKPLDPAKELKVEPVSSLEPVPKPDVPGKRKPGRPKKIESKERLEQLIEAYFDTCKTESRIPTMNGFALALGFADRLSLYNMQTYNGYKPFTNILKRALTRIETAWEEKLVSEDVRAAGPIFWLKQRGWRDERYQDITSQGEKIHQTPVEVKFVVISKDQVKIENRIPEQKQINTPAPDVIEDKSLYGQ
jgi:hypothetical protein